MQNLTSAEVKRVYTILKADRQWRRSERIGFAKRQLWLANRENPEKAPIYRAVLRALQYDYVDKAMAHVR